LLNAECIDQVGQGKIKWKDCPEQALLRDEVMAAWPKDDAGWPKKMSAEDEADYVAGLSDRERHCVVGLGGSQKAEVAWLEAQGIPYEELDVSQFSLEYLTGFQGGSNFANPMLNEMLVSGSNPCAMNLDEGSKKTNRGVVDLMSGRDELSSEVVSNPMANVECIPDNEIVHEMYI
jgi:hypothetical protein